MPSGAVYTDTTFSITDAGSGFELETNKGKAKTVFGIIIQPSGVTFNVPITVILRWDDTDNDGRIDGTNIKEGKLYFAKDGEIITSTCHDGSCSCESQCSACRCDLDTNYLEIDVTSFSQYVAVTPSDTDNDDVPDDFDVEVDNCPHTPNPFQEDSYPPDGNGIGDACECEGDFMCDGDADGSDVSMFKFHFGRNLANYPCTALDTCRGDFDCDHDADGTDAALFKQDFGRSSIQNPCPVCIIGVPWCTY